jgi:chemotaxis protein MotB
MKKLLGIATASIMLVAFSTSCVSKKKYTAAQTHVDKLQQDSTQFVSTINGLKTDLQRAESQYDKYKTQTENEKAALMAQLKQQGTELSEKDQALQMRAQRLRALEDRLNKQQQIVNNLRKTVEDALVNIKSEDLSVEVKNGKVYVSLSDKLLFPSGSASLNKEGKDAIGKLGKVLTENPQINIDVVGHTDSIPIKTAKYSDNWDLSTARATEITRLLTEDYGVKGSRLTASGMSDNQPVATNATKEGRAKNRRTEIILTPKLEELFKILEGESANSASLE